MNDAKDWHFAVLSVVLCLATYFLAFTLDRALVQFKGKLWPATLGRRKKEAPRHDEESRPLEDWLGRRRADE